MKKKYIFINYLPIYLQSSYDAVLLNDKPVNCLIYADDIVLLSTSPEQTRYTEAIL